MEVSDTSAKHVFSVIDTAAGPHLISRQLLSEEHLSKLQTDRDLVNLVDANGQPLILQGAIPIPIIIGNYRVRLNFIVVKQLSADMILECDFLDHHTESIGTKSKTLSLSDGSRVPIYRRPGGKTEENFKPKRSLNRPKRRCIPFKRVRVAQRIVLAPQTETVVLARCDEAGTCFLQPDY